ncbi:DUF4081 domain-containing GNAT family N-acetyltransferase [Arthrobacter sp. Br18]|uniref:GNAT family N-acetyltransferase n=1 Tax=Arthrobacter sp. Br18 TaxID=1312954 RepID=UPI00047A9C4D|nr:DUF4081 domain-containing GNAT family N-acetyltransferase [Arthrobacter sp. Br18]
MAKLLARVAPWLPLAKAPADPPGPWSFRVLGRDDTATLWTLVNRDAVANVFVAAHLETVGSATASFSGGEIIGMFRGDSVNGELVAACWAGVNLVPVGLTDETAPPFGSHLGRAGRTFSSIFGPAGGVMGIWSTFGDYSAEPFDIRPHQPLLTIDTDALLPPAEDLRFTRPDELDALLPACAAMFEEEVGYSPYIGGSEHYRRRVASLISRKHSLAAFDDDGSVIFKAELGTVSSQAVQVQGVWMNPDRRGQGLSAGYMAGVVAAARSLAPTVSLYVNSYNARALASYRRVGFTQVGSFSTVLF